MHAPLSKPTCSTTTTDFPEIIIIIGSGRCGTGYLSMVLMESMDIGFPMDEPKFVVPTYHRLQRFGSLEEPANLRRLIEAIHKSPVFDHLHQELVDISKRPIELLERVREPTYTSVLYATFQFIAEKRGCSRLGYRDPTDVLHLPLLAKLFPSARFVHIIRDGRDAALSFLKFRWGATNLYCGARDWAQAVASGRRDGVSLADRYFEFRFEDLILDTERVAVELGTFINQGRNPEQVQDLVERINRTKNVDNVDAWKHKLNTSQRFLCEAAAGEVLQVCGYPTEFDSEANLSPMKTAYYVGVDYLLRASNRLIRGMRFV